MFEVGSVVLGYVGNVASWRRPASKDLVRRYNPMLTIQLCSTTDESAHTPAQSVTLADRVSLIALRDAINEALKEPQE